MAQHSKTCEQCDQEFRTRWRKQVYCEECQILRALDWGLRPCNCETCGRKYWPLKKSYTQCVSCQALADKRTRSATPCEICQGRFRTAPGHPRACLSCVTKSEINRKQYHKVLRKNLLEKKGTST